MAVLNSDAKRQAVGAGFAAGRRRAGLRLGLWLLLLASCGGARAQLSREYDLKAVFLLNFAQFVEWPAEAFSSPQAPFTIGLLGSDPFGRTLDEVIEKETMRNRTITVRRFQRVEEVKDCQILFVSNTTGPRLTHILTVLRNQPILTVGEMESFLRSGGMVRFVTESGKVRLQINNEAAKAAGLQISAKLLRVAEVVKTDRQSLETP